eukprot:TRINITY_DN14162_c0_g1_i3.p1 TRINITY_DN14162_c0_g1~~TRINITY_DN14162_c0_g1_i3.p1  ORF type:complete len:116 (+),score=20.20 TRINITY_DN14162_c0_g1_i3:563-910(+)
MWVDKRIANSYPKILSNLFAPNIWHQNFKLSLDTWNDSGIYWPPDKWFVDWVSTNSRRPSGTLSDIMLKSRGCEIEKKGERGRRMERSEMGPEKREKNLMNSLLLGCRRRKLICY